MPTKIRELKRMLRKAGFTERRGRGDHTTWDHPRLSKPFTLAGNDGGDARRYQEDLVYEALRQVGADP
jgi:predicted RNA binding protein YcfA (HicA-like mRNA interferase family)